MTSEFANSISVTQRVFSRGRLDIWLSILMKMAYKLSCLYERHEAFLKKISTQKDTLENLQGLYDRNIKHFPNTSRIPLDWWGRWGKVYNEQSDSSCSSSIEMEGGEKPRTRRASRRIIYFWGFASEHTGVGRPW